MISIFKSLTAKPHVTAVLGTVSGWFSWEMIAHAKDAAQFAAGVLASLVSLCALIITGPKAVAQVRQQFATARAWCAKIFTRQ